MDGFLHSLLTLPILHILPRLLIGFYYAFFGLWNLYHWTPILQTLISRRIPLPWLVLQVGIVVQTVAGGMIMAGIFTAMTALLLILFTLPAVIIFHPFWLHKGEQLRLNFTIFMSNITVSVGALLLLITTGN